MPSITGVYHGKEDSQRHRLGSNPRCGGRLVEANHGLFSAAVNGSDRLSAGDEIMQVMTDYLSEHEKVVLYTVLNGIGTALLPVSLDHCIVAILSNLSA